MLQGQKIRLRTVRASDLDPLYALANDYTDAGEYMPLAVVSEVSFQQAFAEHGFWHDHSGKLVIEDVQGQLVGEAGLFKAAHYMDGRELYYRIFSGHRGRGYAREALSLLTKLFFESTPFARLQAVIVDGNDVSAHILERCGFRREGTLRGARQFNGRQVDLIMYSLLRSEYLARLDAPD
ncbi:GNAT family N-acetyltransferase [Aestuariibacter halophilus]|uniref:GNAT family N-acetyltransferase n=1 Tax=Fluctibacter halophilus TaxID=226011 RepID=A0ABS8GAZ5_9ALTE|nr:GNAT family protein [Aestuariibacter halophilus]MCC2617759.1 GNAT family N-acetyltransferase [Aestuariibacter halophilus]